MKKKSFALGYSLIVNWFFAWVFYNFACSVSLSVFRTAVADLHGYSTAVVLKMSTYTSIAVGLLLLFMPKLLSRFGARWLSGIGMVLGGLTYMAIPFSPTPLVLGILIALTSLFAGLYCSIGTMIMVSKWFPRKKGTVMGIITSAGIVASGVFLPLFNKIYLSSGITTAMMVMGGLQVVFGIADFFWLRDTPEEVGLLPDNMPMTKEEEEELTNKGNVKSTWTYLKLLKNGRFWLVSMGWSLMLTGLCCLSFVAVSALTDNGVSYDMAITISSILGVVTFISSVVSGFLDTKIGVVKTSIIVVGLMGISMLILGFGGSSIPFWLIVGATVIARGFAGAPNNLFSSQVLSMYGPVGYSTAYSLFLVITNLKFVASWIDGQSLQVTGSYNTAIIIGGVLELVGLVLIALAGTKQIPEPEKEKNA